MEFLKHLSIEAISGLIVILCVLIIFVVKIIIERLTTDINKNFAKVNLNIEFLFIEIQSSDYANDYFLSNGESFIDIKERKKSELVKKKTDELDLQNKMKVEKAISA